MPHDCCRVSLLQIRSGLACQLVFVVASFIFRAPAIFLRREINLGKVLALYSELILQVKDDAIAENSSCDVMNIQKDDLFVLCCLWDCRAYLRSLYSDDPGLAFNIPYTPIDIYASIDKLNEMKVLKISRRKSMGGQNVVGLTEIGREYFEEYFSVDWKNYISTLQKRCFGKIFAVNVCSEEMIEKSRNWLCGNVGRDVFRLTVERSTQLLYWKKMDCFRVLIKFNPGVPEEIIYKMIDMNYSDFDRQLAKN